MAVYTQLNSTAITELLAHYDVGSLQHFSAISAGVENSNYAVYTDRCALVLTVFEHHDASQVTKCVRLARHLDEQGIDVPAPLSDRHGRWLQTYAHKPLIFCQRFAGHHVRELTAAHCAAIGQRLAQLHLVAQSLQPRSDNSRGYHWWQATAKHRLQPSSTLSREDQTLLRAALKHIDDHHSTWETLPQGWIHADLFHDNVLFSDTDDVNISAILDLYNACEGAWLYDLAIVANDWCCDRRGHWLPHACDALLAGYQHVRALTTAEHKEWPNMLCAAALRFWLSRLVSVEQQKDTALAQQKDPNEYRAKLALRLDEAGSAHWI